jgi:hypothetical protein
MIGSLLAMLLVAQESPLPTLDVFKEDLWRVFQVWFQTGDLMEGNGSGIEGGALRNYTYTETTTLINRDSGGKTRDTETSVHHVILGPEPWQNYRKLISKNGVPLSAAELEKQDREQKKREQKLKIEMEKAAREAEKKKAAQQSKPPAPAGKEDEMFCSPTACPFNDFVTRVYDIQVVRREVIDGYATVLITFKKKAGLKPKSVDEKFLQHLKLHAWITEQEHQPLRLEVQLLNPVSFGYGVFGKIQPGSGGVQERRKINDEVWAPVRVEMSMAGRLLVVKRNQRQITEFSDFKKYSVETRMNVVPDDR